ncbi:hypothetical protein GGR20_000025 [Devosia subaequoris]|uniref:Uncharacterized protein n=1 Tax=Devosia subaequoris TaxID=395930 RepID=A0A7W6IJI8_9HYPH|nr:hypothetical protein [Devosia subaequoris]MBB4050407.1 hypothetical protein [Devosia subaequoris]MCP1208901.1 hypothetical protein [Devosia subaequoris]
MTDGPEELARILVDQHYAAGPAQLKAALAQAFAERDRQEPRGDDARKALLKEVSELEKTSTRGSE